MLIVLILSKQDIRVFSERINTNKLSFYKLHQWKQHQFFRDLACKFWLAPATIKNHNHDYLGCLFSGYVLTTLYKRISWCIAVAS
jgi:hypothetical protein